MNTSKTLFLVAVLAAAPFTISAASAQYQHANPTNTTMQQHDRTTTDLHRTDQRTMGNSSMNERDMRHGDMRHYGWRRGHHYGWRHCTVRWHHHHRVRVCR